ncbi:hypothetical protein, partial [Streptomyces sp. NPDC059349]
VNRPRPTPEHRAWDRTQTQHHSQWRPLCKPGTFQSRVIDSYVDVCVSGCLEVEEEFPASRAAKFAQEFFTGTTDWKTPWINDRIYPWRPFVHVPQANRIDTLIRDQLGEEMFRSISLPGVGA